jgi:hypothetical protein
MKYLLDTDHLSILQRQTGKDYSNLSTRMAHYPLSDFAVSIVTFHEQMLGCHAYINRERTLTDIVKGYEMMARLVSDFKVLPLILIIMIQEINAIFDGKSLQLESPLNLDVGTRVRIIVETILPQEKTQKTFFETAQSLQLQGNPDWSEKID